MSSLEPSSANNPERFLREASWALHPSAASRRRVMQRVRSQVASPVPLLHAARVHAEPHLGSSLRVLQSVLRRVHAPKQSAGMWQEIRNAVVPPKEARQTLWARIAERLQPAPVAAYVRPLRWVATFTVLLFVARMAPMLVLPSRTVAESPVLFIPIGGEVRVSIGGLLQRVSDQVTLKDTATLETGKNGSATLILHDDVVVRMGEDTTLSLEDDSDRPAFQGDRTMTLHHGTLWIQGFVPSTVRAITVGSPHGSVVIHEGSISIHVDDEDLRVALFDRYARVERGNKTAPLVAGEQVTVTVDGGMSIRSIPKISERDTWVQHNLQLDAVHRKELAVRKQQERIASAGILPTSPLYVVKRAAEKMDEVFTLHQDSRVQKQLQNAETRLNEAVALVTEGSLEAATAPLQEYKDTIIGIATGSGGDAVVKSLLQEQVAEAAADIVVALPSDAQSLPLKEAVLQTSAAIPGGDVKAEDVKGILLVDALTSIRRDVESGDLSGARGKFEELQKTYPSMDTVTSPLQPEVRREAETTLAGLFITLGGEKPVAEQASASPIRKGFLSDAARAAIVRRITAYKSARSQYNQFAMEIRSLKRFFPQEEGPVLRALLKENITPDLQHYVQIEMRRLKQQLLMKEGSGSKAGGL